MFGCAGPELRPEERALFGEAQPFGFILFRRNCETPGQVRALVAALRASVGRPDAPVLIDQEGGRVERLRPPHWPSLPPARRIGELAERDPEAGAEAARLNGRLLAETLRGLGITVDCAPVCDVLTPDTHAAIGDRAFSSDPRLVADLARALAEGLLDGGVLPVVKHMPGHGRARVDSHLDLPVVDAPAEALANTDFVPFRALADLPLGMTAHIVFRALDPERPATTSRAVIGGTIRGALGFEGLLFSDDVSMSALRGGMAERAHAILDAGCDVVLHCNGRLDEMAELAAVVPPVTGAAAARWEGALGRVTQPEPIETGALRARYDALLARGAALG